MIIVRAPAAPRGRESGFPASVGTPESVPASPAPAKAGGPRPSGLAACTGDPDSRPREAAGARTFIFHSLVDPTSGSGRERSRSAARSGHYGK